MSRRPRTRTALLAPVLALALVAGCSSDDGESDAEASITPGGTEDAGGDGEPDTAADEAELEQLFLDYWAAMVELENSEELDPTVFDGLAADEVREQQVARVEPFKEAGIIAEGEPVITEVTANAEGDRATIEGCVNRDDWLFYDEEGEEVPVESDEATDAKVVEAERGADGWVISRHARDAEVTLSC